MRLALLLAIASIITACSTEVAQDPTERVWTDEEKGINCWYVTKPGIYNRNPGVECIPIMEEGGYYEETR